MAFNQTLFRNPNRGGRMLSEYPDGDAPTLDQGADGLVFEEFNSIYQINPLETDPKERDLWSQYQGGEQQGANEYEGLVSVSQNDPYSGSNAALSTVEPGGGSYFQFLPYDKSVFEYKYLKEVVVDDLAVIGSWTNNTYNRMAMYYKTAPQLSKNVPGQFNSYIGTYCRNTSAPRASSESDNLHFYHRFNLPYTNGRWAKLLMDQHPTHIRSANGGTEQGNQPNPTGETGLNYFDTLTRFYITNYLTYITNNQQDTLWYFDKFTLYEETNQENEEQVYMLCGFYDPSDNRLFVGWNRNKDENEIIHDVRYSFNSIHDIGWDAATVAPNGSITPPGFQGYNGMEYDNDTIVMGANTSIYVGIKPQNSTLFKQIQIDLT